MVVQLNLEKLSDTQLFRNGEEGFEQQQQNIVFNNIKIF